MKIADTKPPSGVRASGAAAQAARVGAAGAAGTAGEAGAARAAPDVATVMDIPESEFTPKVRAAIMTLMAEVEKLRRELQQNQQRLQHLERLANQDALLPVANRRAFVRELSRAMSFCERYGGLASVIYFDVNGLKQINDTLGHAAGDAVLERVARTLVEHVRESDFVARIGGDEFGVILVQADEKVAHEKAVSLAAAVDARPLDWHGTMVAVRVSWGAYSFKGGADAAQVLDAADRDMYSRKRGGAAAG